MLSKRNACLAQTEAHRPFRRLLLLTLLLLGTWPAAAATITAVVPDRAVAGQQVELRGAGFDVLFNANLPTLAGPLGLAAGTVGTVAPLLVPPEVRFGSSSGPVAACTYVSPGVLRITVPDGARRGPVFLTRTTTRVPPFGNPTPLVTVLCASPNFVPLRTFELTNSYQYHIVKAELRSPWGSVDLLAAAGLNYLTNSGPGRVLRLDVPIDYYDLWIYMGTISPAGVVEPWLEFIEPVDLRASGPPLGRGGGRLTAEWLLNGQWNSGQYSLMFSNGAWVLRNGVVIEEQGSVSGGLWTNYSGLVNFKLNPAWGNVQLLLLPNWPVPTSPLTLPRHWTEFEFQFAGRPSLKFKRTLRMWTPLP